MAFLNNLGKKIGSAAEATASKAKEVAEVTKLNSRISDEEKQIEKLYIEIGKTIFQQHKDDPEFSVAELCANILTSQANIEALQQKIEETKSSKDQSTSPS